MDRATVSDLPKEVLETFSELPSLTQAMLLMRAALRAHFRNASDPDRFLAGSRAALAFFVAIKSGRATAFHASERGAIFAHRLGAYRLSLPNKHVRHSDIGTRTLREMARDWSSDGESGTLPGPFIHGSGLRFDLERLNHLSAENLFSGSLMDAMPMPNKVWAEWGKIREKLEADPKDKDNFNFWIKWYEDVLVGRDRNWELDHLVGSIDEATWEAGASTVASKILEIEARLGVLSSAQSAKGVIRETQAEIIGIGHNSPPENIDDASISTGDFDLALKEINYIERETHSDNPKRQEVARANDEVRSFLNKCVFWLGGKLDTSAEEFFKILGQGAAASTLGIIGVAIFRIVEALKPMIRAVENWLAFL